METPAAQLMPGDRIDVALTLKHVVVIGPQWRPEEVWLTDTTGHVHTLPGDASVILLERHQP